MIRTPFFDLRDVPFQQTADLRWPGDGAHMTAAIDWLGKSNIPVCRTSAIHLKIGPLSFYPGSGTLNFDNQRRLPEKGLTGLKAILERVTRQQFPPID